jgi:glutathione S-transferase
MPFFVRPIVRAVRAKTLAGYIGPQLRLHLDYMESQLAAAPWFCGSEFTAADIQMSFPLEIAVARSGLDESRPNLMAFLRRIQERPAYRRALDRSGRYDYALA